MKFKTPYITVAVILVLIIVLAVVAALRIRAARNKEIEKQVELNSQNPNVVAFLKAIRFAEGTLGPDGYRTMFTGKLFNSYSAHPNEVNCSGSLCSTAAGAYQFLFTTWQQAASALNLSDFSPENQDKAALYLIASKNALNDVVEGNFESAISKVNTVWASLPGAPYGQPTKTLAQMKSSYTGFGGSIA